MEVAHTVVSGDRACQRVVLRVRPLKPLCTAMKLHPVQSTEDALQTDLGSTPAEHQRRQGFWAALWVCQALTTGPWERLDSLHMHTTSLQQLLAA